MMLLDYKCEISEYYMYKNLDTKVKYLLFQNICKMFIY